MPKQPTLFDDIPEMPEPSSRPGAWLPPDQAARDFAVDPRHHVVLEASAGTGKTRVLVTRYVNLIRAGVDPEHILAITFTRKAAAEMRERVLTELRRQAAQDDVMRKRWRTLETRLTDINILTIDAFCFGLLREFPLEANVDPAFEIADETEMARYVNEAIALALRAAHGLVAGDEHVRLLFARVRPFQLRSALETLLNQRDVAQKALGAFVSRHAQASSTAQICSTFVNRIAAIVADGPEAAAILRDGPAKSAAFRWLLEDLRTLPALACADHADVRRFRSRVEAYFTRDNKARKQAANAYKSMFESPAAKKRHEAAIKELAPRVLEALDALDRDVNALLARGLQRLFVITVQKYERLLEDHAVLDFPAMLDRAVALLEQQAEFARSRLKLQSRYHHVLVDELQDTSRKQWRLIELLVRAWQEGEGPEDTAPSIFVVGDRKQSIYRFRQAEVTLLDEAARFIGGLRPGSVVKQAIHNSFRAVPELLAFVNAVSEETQSGSQLPERFEYREHDRFPPSAIHPRALRDNEPVLGVIAETSVQDSAVAVAAEVARLLDGTMVRTEEGTRPIEPQDVGILFRARAGHQFFERALEDRGIRTYVSKGLGFFDAPEVQDLQALIRYLAEPESDLRAAEFLRSRFVRLSDDGLVKLAPGLAQALREPAFDEIAIGLDPIDAPMFARVRASVAKWLGLVDRLPPAELLDRVISESAYVHEIAGRRLAQARENIKKVRALVRRVQNRGYTTMRRLADYFETLRAGDEANAIIEARGAVNLMTIHAAKGLEFPVVFLVNLQQSARGPGGGISVIANGPGGEPDVAIGTSSDGTILEAEREDEELRRLLYVALTRARDRLYLAVAVKDGRLDSRKSTLAGLLPLSLRGVLQRAALITAEEQGLPVMDWMSASAQAFAFRVCRRPEAAAIVSREAPPASHAPVDVAPLTPMDAPRIAATAIGPGITEVQPAAADRASGSDRLIGTLVHRLFQRRIPDAPVAELAGIARALIRPEEWADADETEDVSTVATRAAGLYAHMRARPDVAAVLSGSACHYEVPFSCRLPGDGAIVRGSIDCLAVKPDGTVTILEFKTGAPRPQHHAQLDVYRLAVTALWPGQQVDAILVYPYTDV